MALFNRSHTTFDQSAIVSIALSRTISRTIFEIIDAEEYHDLEI